MGKFSEFNLPLKSLPEGVHEFRYDLDRQFFKNMESGDIRDAKIAVDLTVTYRNGVYDLKFVFKGAVTVACDRCLDDLELPVDTGYHVTVKYGDSYKDESDEFIEIPESDNFLNVAYMMFDTVSLSVPIKHVHPLGKCNRAMSSLLKKHRALVSGDTDADFGEDLIEDLEAGESPEETPPQESSTTDPRWDALKDFGTKE